MVTYGQVVQQTVLDLAVAHAVVVRQIGYLLPQPAPHQKLRAIARILHVALSHQQLCVHSHHRVQLLESLYGLRPPALVGQLEVV